MADNDKSAEKGEDSFAPKGHGKERYRREPEEKKYREGCYPCRWGFARLLCIVGSHCGSNKIQRGFICVGRLRTKQALYLVRLRVHIRHRVAGVSDGLTQGRLI